MSLPKNPSQLRTLVRLSKIRAAARRRQERYLREVQVGLALFKYRLASGQIRLRDPSKEGTE
jgi:hypothetical protein